MANACVQSEYFSGQGSFLLADLDENRVHQGFRAVGNVSAASISVEVTEFEHKESCSGSRGIDLTITQETNPTLTFTLESLSKENLELILFGASTDIAAGSATSLEVTGYTGLWSPLDHVNVTSVVVMDETDTTTYVEGTDYEVNLSAGSIQPISGGGITDGDLLHIDYDYEDQAVIQALVSSKAPDLAARFEGLNTADENKPVVVTINRVSTQPLAELALINDEIAQAEVTAKILLDATKPTGEQYFKVQKI